MCLEEMKQSHLPCVKRAMQIRTRRAQFPWLDNSMREDGFAFIKLEDGAAPGTCFRERSDRSPPTQGQNNVPHVPRGVSA